MGVVAIGGSAGAFDILRLLARSLPRDFPLPVLLVLHLSPHAPSLLHTILSREGGMEAVHPRSGEVLRPGCIYVAPPDCHLVVRKNGNVRGETGVWLERGPRENLHRPSINVLFRSVARVFGARSIGVVLSGMLDDGAAGLFAIAAAGGKTVVQDPNTADARDMPDNAMRELRADWVLPPDQIAPKLIEISRMQPQARRRDLPPRTKPTEMSCPECGGVLSNTGEAPNFLRCRVGHAYGLESLAAKYSENVEVALWVAVRAMREKAALARSMCQHVSSSAAKNRLEERASESDRHGDSVLGLIHQLRALAAE